MTMLFDTPLGPVGQLSHGPKSTERRSRVSVFDLGMVIVAFGFILVTTLFAGNEAAPIASADVGIVAATVAP